MPKSMIAGCALLIVLTSSIGCATSYDSRPVSFRSQGDMIFGVLNTPSNHAGESAPLVIFVHGDGALPADAHGYYSSIWTRLADAGIATLSWDKKGVGRSEGDWLSQSMDDRAQEVLDAINHIRSAFPVEFPVIGLLGFSQAGWVLPEVVHRSTVPGFMIIVSGAINWQRQGEYLARQRLTLAGASAMEIEAEIRRQKRDRFLLDPDMGYSDYTRTLSHRCGRADHVCETPLSEARFGFVKRNRMVDATERLEEVTIPTFAMFGDSDRNVDYQESFDTYRRTLAKGPARRSHVRLYPGATHGLLKASGFDTVSPGWWTLVKMAWQGEDAFADGVLDDIVAFANREAAR